MTNQDIAKKLGAAGGNATKKNHGKDYYRELAKKSHQQRKANKRLKELLFAE